MTRQLSDGQRTYEAKRAAKAGMSLDKWLADKDQQKAEAERERAKAAEPPKPPKKRGVLSRLIDRAHQPLKPSSK